MPCQAAGQRCVLLPVREPDHFPALGSLLQAVQRLATDRRSVRLAGMFTTSKTAADFTASRFATHHDDFTVLTLERTLRDRYNMTLADLAHLIEARPKRGCWEGSRMMGGLKKILGTIEAGRLMGCELVWVVDADSRPIRQFSFSAIFDDFVRDPQLLSTNLSHPAILATSRIHQLTECAAKGLRLQTARRPFASYRATDYWIHRPASFIDMVRHIESEGESLVSRFCRFPASEAIYYGLFMEHVQPEARRCVRSASFPELLWEETPARSFGYGPSLRNTGTNTGSVAGPPSRPIGATLRQMLQPKVFHEISTPLLTCNQSLAPDEQLQILRGPLSWMHGWRFDNIHAGCRDHTVRLLQQLPHISWATSNYLANVGGSLVSLEQALSFPLSAVTPAPTTAPAPASRLMSTTAPRNMTAAQAVHFLHIPKTAGTTIAYLLPPRDAHYVESQAGLPPYSTQQSAPCHSVR